VSEGVVGFELVANLWRELCARCDCVRARVLWGHVEQTAACAHLLRHSRAITRRHLDAIESAIVSGL
jgi:hypothetical protein